MRRFKEEDLFRVMFSVQRLVDGFMGRLTLFKKGLSESIERPATSKVP